eukprot:364009-Chlamydomonas_euryale.AAC.2
MWASGRGGTGGKTGVQDMFCLPHAEILASLASSAMTGQSPPMAGREVLKRNSRFSGGGYETSYPLRISGNPDLADIRNCTSLAGREEYETC